MSRIGKLPIPVPAGVEVSINGRDEVVINGAGVHELKLKPGDYNVRKSKPGQTGPDEVVTITRGGRTTLKVTYGKTAHFRYW